MKKLILAAVIAGLASGCTTRLVDFTIISSKNIDLSRGAEFKRMKSRVEGEHVAHIIIFIPTGVPNAKEALDRAIESIPGAVALLDGVITRKFFWIPYIYGQDRFIVEGTPLVDPAQTSASLPGRYNLAWADASGRVQRIEAVSQSEFEQHRASRM